MGDDPDHQFKPSKATTADEFWSRGKDAPLFIVPIEGVSVASPAPRLTIQQNHGCACVVKVTAIGDASERTTTAP
jgi:hypothetical protein